MKENEKKGNIKKENGKEENEMDVKKYRLVVEGNAVYELDLECLRKKKGDIKSTVKTRIK